MKCKFEEMVNIANKEKIEPKEIIDYCKQNNVSLVEFLDQFSIQIAKKYLSGELDFSFCDHIMNNIFGFMTTDEEFYKLNNIDEGPAFNIYLAFDRGEYYHSEEERNIIPADKYTKPDLIKLIKELES
jgi:hypothetical protein